MITILQRFLLFLPLALSLAGAGNGELIAGSPEGHLVIIGGGDRTMEIMQRFIDLAGPKDKAKIVVIPLASSEPAVRAPEYVAEFQSYGFKNVIALVVTRQQAMAESTATLLKGATGVYLSGGDQSRIAAALVGTPVQAMLLQLYAQGAVIGGSSAGAAIMSKVMITGNEHLHRDSSDEEDPRSSFTFIKKNNIETIEGLGFLTHEIIDQHFVARKRHNRLLSMAFEHPKLLGIGIDEATAIVVDPDRTFQVVGEGTVVVYDASRAKNVKTDKNGNLSGNGISVSVLSAGERYDLVKRRVIQDERMIPKN